MKGKGRTVVIHPRSIRRTFLGRVVSGRAGGVGGGGGGGRRRRIDPIHHGGIYIPAVRPPLAPFPVEGRFSPISLPFLSIPPGPSPASRGCFSPARPAYAATFGACAQARTPLPLPLPLNFQPPFLPPLSSPRSSYAAADATIVYASNLEKTEYDLQEMCFSRKE